METEKVKSLADVAKLAMEEGGKYVQLFAEDLDQELKQGTKGVEANFERYAARLFAAIIFDRMGLVPHMVKFATACDTLLFGSSEQENLDDMADLAVRNPRLLVDKRDIAKNYVDQTMSLAAKMGGLIQNKAREESGNTDLEEQIRNELASTPREELAEMLSAIRMIRERRVSEG